MSESTPAEIVKTRDDRDLVRLAIAETTPQGGVQFKLKEGSTCSWAAIDTPISLEKLRSRIEPWLTALVQSEHLALLVGSGLAHAVHYIATGLFLPGMSGLTFDVFNETIEKAARETAQDAARGDGNVEDQLRVALELLRGLQILAVTKVEVKDADVRAQELARSVEKCLDLFADSILKGESSFAASPNDKRAEAIGYLVSFLMSFASRSGTRERLQIFTTNYDRFIELGAEAAGLRLIDRFVGSLAPIFRASRLDVDMHYSPPGIRGEPRYLEGVARFSKLHGSVDWFEIEGTIRRLGIPFGAEDLAPFLSVPRSGKVDATNLMIFPNAAKDREASGYPYVELFRDLAASICRPNSTVVCYGYSFGDEHINRVIEDMLTIPSTHLVVIAYSDPLGRILETYERLGKSAQMTLLIGKHVADLPTLVKHFLPKPAIDRTTFKMADLLKARLGTAEENKKGEHASKDAQEDKVT